MADWRTGWYPHAMTAMRGLRGDGAPGTDGVPMPLLQASDGIPLLGQVSPAIVSMLKRLMRDNGDMAGKCVSSEALDDGILYISPATLAEALGNSISVADYVAGVGKPGAAYKRSIGYGGKTYEPWLQRNAITGDEIHLLKFARQCMADWQRAVDAAAVMLASAVHASDTSNTLAVGTFLSALRSVCSDLDVLAENPPMTTADKIKGAALSALHETEQWAGKQAANLSEEVGKLAGNVASGFFSQAGLLSLTVAGLAVFLFVK